MPWKFWRRGSLPNTTRRLHRYRPGFETLEARTTPTVFSNPAPASIQIQEGEPANPYPSVINVAGLNGTIANLTVTLRGVNHGRSGDIDVLLVGPQGQKLILISDAGEQANTGVTIIFDDNGSLIDQMGNGWADGATNTTVIRRPVNYEGPEDSFPAPAPSSPYIDPGSSATGTNILTSTFAGTNPNGAWNLFVVDDESNSNSGVIQGGWSLDINDSVAPAADVAVTVTAAPGPRRVRYTVTVRNLGPADAKSVVLSDLLPPRTVFVSQAQTSGPAFVLGNKGNQITNTIDLLPNGATATFLVFATARRGRVFNTASVSSATPDLTPANNVSSVATLIGNKNRRWLAQVYRDLIKREIGPPALKNGENFLNQPGDPRTLRVQYLRNLLDGLVYLARISHDYYEYILDKHTSFADCVKSLDFLSKGGSPEQLRAWLYGGQEYFANSGGNNAGWAAAVFQDIFGRPIDAAGQALIRNQLASGLSRQAVSQNLLNTTEAQVRVVNRWFQRFLQRQPTQAELNHYVNDLRNGVPDDQLIATIVASQEYYQKV